MISSRLIALTTAALIASAVAGCGGGGTTTISTPAGVDLTVPTDVPDDEALSTLTKAIFDQIDYEPEVEDCIQRHIETVPVSQVRQFVDMPESERDAAVLKLSTGFANQCVESGDNIVAPNPSEDTLKIVRYSLEKQIEIIFTRKGLPRSLTNCVKRKLEAAPGQELVDVLNGTFAAQSRYGEKLALSCIPG